MDSVLFPPPTHHQHRGRPPPTTPHCPKTVVVLPSLSPCKRALPPRTFGFVPATKVTKKQLCKVRICRQPSSGNKLKRDRPMLSFVPGPAAGINNYTIININIAKNQLCKVRNCRQRTMASRPFVEPASVIGLFLYFWLADRGL